MIMQEFQMPRSEARPGISSVLLGNAFSQLPIWLVGKTHRERV